MDLVLLFSLKHYNFSLNYMNATFSALIVLKIYKSSALSPLENFNVGN